MLCAQHSQVLIIRIIIKMRIQLQHIEIFTGQNLLSKVYNKYFETNHQGCSTTFSSMQARSSVTDWQLVNKQLMNLSFRRGWYKNQKPRSTTAKTTNKAPVNIFSDKDDRRLFVADAALSTFEVIKTFCGQQTEQGRVLTILTKESTKSHAIFYMDNLHDFFQRAGVRFSLNTGL